MGNITIKLAIVGARITQRRAALDSMIPESKLSAAICGRGTLTEAETRRLAGVLGIPATALAAAQTVSAGA